MDPIQLKDHPLAGISLDAIAKASTAIVSVSFVLGLFGLFGRCIGASFSALYFVTFADVVNGTIIYTPLTLLGVIIGFIHRAAHHGRPEVGSDLAAKAEKLASRLDALEVFAAVSFLSLVAMLLLAPPYYPYVFFVSGTVVFLLVMDRLPKRLKTAPLGPQLGLLVFILALAFGIFLTNACIMAAATSASADPSDVKDSRMALVCTEVCERGRIFMRLTDVTVVGFGNDTQTITFLKNEDIRRVVILAAKRDEAFFSIPEAYAWVRTNLKRLLSWI